MIFVVYIWISYLIIYISQIQSTEKYSIVPCYQPLCLLVGLSKIIMVCCYAIFLYLESIVAIQRIHPHCAHYSLLSMQQTSIHTWRTQTYPNTPNWTTFVSIVEIIYCVAILRLYHVVKVVLYWQWNLSKYFNKK